MKQGHMKGGGHEKAGLFQIALRLLCCALVLFPDFAVAAPVHIPGFYGPNILSVVPATALPKPLPGGTMQGLNTNLGNQGNGLDYNDSQNRLTVYQNQANAIIDWKKFNIGSNASVQFYQGTGTPGTKNWQPNSSYAALNRIWDSSPSQIYGTLRADGKIFLINQNGILFGPGSQVNVGSLVASALNMTNKDFLNNAMNFYPEGGTSTGDVDISGNPYNYTVNTPAGKQWVFTYPTDPASGNPSGLILNNGQITAAPGGNVFLIGPQVVNGGKIEADYGQVGLIAGTRVYLVPYTNDDPRTAPIVEILGGPGEVWNLGPADGVSSGQLLADQGIAGMYGHIVNQDGLVRSITSVKHNGQIELRAVDTPKTATDDGEGRIITGQGSVTESPLSDSGEMADNTFPYRGGIIIMDGLETAQYGSNGTTTAIPAGQLFGQPLPADIEHDGTIYAPGGTVTMNAAKQVIVGASGLIDVSGYWSNESSTATLLDAMLDSTALRDDYAQKGGVLPGQTVTTSTMAGTTLGNISANITGLAMTAWEKGIEGGNISITASGDATKGYNGVIDIQPGSKINFSGGGINYSGGGLAYTKLISGTKIYDISSAPQNIHYDSILGQYTKTYARFGQKDSYTGIYYGSAAPLQTPGAGFSFTRGGDAGSLQLAAKTVELGGQIMGSAVRGYFQTINDGLALTKAEGLEVPTAGALTIDTTALTRGEANVQATVGAGSGITVLSAGEPSPDGQSPVPQSLISADSLNAAGLGSLTLESDSNVTINGNAQITLAAGGSFSASAKRVEIGGGISAASGNITLTAVDTLENNSGLTEGIFLDQGSSLDVSGQKVDNSMARSLGKSVNYGQIQGGKVDIEDQTTSNWEPSVQEPLQSVDIESGAKIDVSGGWQIDAKGNVTAGSAGSLNVVGSTIKLNGELRGYALPDGGGKVQGGQVSIYAKNIDVTSGPSGSGPSSPGLVLPADYFADTGFSRIELDSLKDVNLEPSATISPSLVRLKPPVPRAWAGGANAPLASFGAVGETVPGHDDLIRLANDMAYEAGPTSFTANAGMIKGWQGADHGPGGSISIINPKPDAAINIYPGAAISMTPGGSINLNAYKVTLGNVTLAGTLYAPAGKIGINASNTVDISGQILATGYNRPDPSSSIRGHGLNYIPMDGGQVTLSASSLILESGSVIDISGSGPAPYAVLVGGHTLTYGQASNPGSLTLTGPSAGLTALDIDDGAVLKAWANMAGIQGGGLAVTNTNISGGLLVAGAPGAGKNSVNIKSLAGDGFDNITLQSLNSLNFSESMDVTVGRHLTLDAPDIAASGQNINVNLRSLWITLAKSYMPPPVQPASASGNSQLNLFGFGSGTGPVAGWIDVTGSVNIDGFKQVGLYATRDIRLSDYPYSTNTWAGGLYTVGDVVLKASRIYSTTESDFVIQSAGKVTVLPADNPVLETIYSAGGKLQVSAAGGIDIEGTLAAPMGTITLGNDSGFTPWIHLGGSSLVTASGKDAAGNNTMVNWGTVDINNDGAWQMTDKSTNQQVQAVLPTQSVTISAPGGEIVFDKGAKIDVSGGGSLYAYQFQPGIEGSNDPLAGCFVVLPDNSLHLPDYPAVYLMGGAGLKPGIYSLLPEQYAFLPGAVVLKPQNVNITPGLTLASSDGYPVIAGYSTVLGTSYRGIRPAAYSVMPALDVRKRGNFSAFQSQTMGDAGDVTIRGKTATVEGRIQADALDGYLGGKISLIAFTVDVFHQGSTLQQAGQDVLYIADSSLDSGSFREIDLGNETATNTVEIGQDVDLAAPIISLAASNQIIIDAGAQLTAKTAKSPDSGEGMINFITPSTGNVDFDPASALHATYGVGMNVSNITGFPKINIGDSSLVLENSEIGLGLAGDKPYNFTGLYLTPDNWGALSNFDDITLMSSHDIEFTDNVNLSANNSLTLDAAQILGSNAGGTNVTLIAPTVNIKNSEGATPLGTAAANNGNFAVNASNQINVGSGDVLLSGFKSIYLNSRNDLTLKGKGSLATGGADLNVMAARVVTAGGRPAGGAYVAPNFRVVAGTSKNDLNPAGAITMVSSFGQPGAAAGAGGTLEFLARNIEVSTIVQSDGGTIKLTSTGSGPADGILLNQGAKILAYGTNNAPGGQVILQADNGTINVEPGSLIDVSAGKQGDAGSIGILAPGNEVAIGGDLYGNPNGGAGGSFTIDTFMLSDDGMNFIENMNSLNGGGFTGNLDIRARTGNIDIKQGEKLSARSIKLTADDSSSGYGEININGTLDGENIELYSYQNLNVNGRINAADLAVGGNVLLSSETEWVNINPGGVVDVSGGGKAGSVYLRAQQNGADDVNINMGYGSIRGASSVYVEAFKKYSYQNPDGRPFSINVSKYTGTTGWLADAKNFYNSNNVITRLKPAAPDGAAFELLPGIEVDTTGDITLDQALDLTSIRFGGNPGVLTLRAGGNLNINGNLTDAPSGMLTGPHGSIRNSWGFNLVAGADMTASGMSTADYMSTSASAAANGNLNIGAPNSIWVNPVVYTESAPIRFASAGDTYIGQGQYTPLSYMINNAMRYNLATFSGSIQGSVGGDLAIDGGAIQTASGDINIDIGGNLDLTDEMVHGFDTLGAIRTTGYLPAPSGYSYLPANNGKYEGGGSINLDVAGNVGKNVSGSWTTARSDNAWDMWYSVGRGGGVTYWSASYGRYSSGSTATSTTAGVDTTAGIATMGGGSVMVRTGGDFLTQAGTFGQNSPGGLKIFAGGNVEGRFLNHGVLANPQQGAPEQQGTMEIHAGGNFGARGVDQVIEAFASRADVSALGDITLGTVVNPTIAIPKFASIKYLWDLTYTENTAVSLKAGGDITFTGSSPFYGYPSGAVPENDRVLPATVDMEAGGDIHLESEFALAPAPQGNLTIIAGGNIDDGFGTIAGAANRSAIYVSDFETVNIVNTSYNVYTSKPFNFQSSTTSDFADFLFDPKRHGGTGNNNAPLHGSDQTPVTVSAGGDISNLELFLPKQSRITAGGNIKDLYYLGQNVNSTDISEILAGGDIVFHYLGPSAGATGVEQDGPGNLILQAGGSINLGNSNGISAWGNLNNSLLDPAGCRIFVIAGYAWGAKNESTLNNLASGEAGEFFNELQDEGKLWTMLMNGAGGVTYAEKTVQTLKTDLAKAFAAKMRQAAGSDDVLYKDLIAGGDATDAGAILDEEENRTVAPRLNPSGGAGNIEMTSSQIGSNGPGGDIYIIAKGAIDVGKSAFFDPNSKIQVQNTGIFTSAGGAINIFADRDVNVNESRVMTFFGGDITVWSDHGNINAGRGAKTAVNASPPKNVTKYDQNGRPIGSIPIFIPPQAGSGIRAVTFSPGAGQQAPPAGDIYAFAPRGTLDAGEAGISGNTVFLGARQVLNAINISSLTGVTYGVPVGQTVAAPMPSLSGAGTVGTGTAQLAALAAALSTASTSSASRAIDQLTALDWLDVKVIDISDQPPASDQSTHEKKHKREQAQNE